ncbi:uncharacterized protein K444DRAFT_706143 [Hyaloscypha bicolor E]|uniref:Uncharacterized protein n=1 Tax=Hyaloscypha bicolor E TaxID=1095630 RepID=A0A2J6SP43_9HELO|nr:uncharacterized protein K444DRAFT_706143 [Hyaloscypha bicolor E]PMD52551.1 hypothetical protein K444DRAFT_706143 [Hyaloscypha bicolor E]
MLQLTRSIVRNSRREWKDVRDIALHMLLIIVEFWGMVVILPAFLVLPGIVFSILCIMSAGLIAVLTWPLHGSRVVSSGKERKRNLEQLSGVKLLYINGSITSQRGFRSHINSLSLIFGRPVIGVYNPTNGLVIDILEMLLLRSIPYPSRTSTTLYTQLRELLLPPSTRKVLVIAHGTGASILSSVLSKLHNDLPIDILSKLEIFTFGSAATYLSNSLLAQHSRIIGEHSTTYPGAKEEIERVIPYIEHYAFSADIFARCGILKYMLKVLDNRFYGRLFVLNATPHTGLTFTQYLQAIFPANAKGSMLDEVVGVDVLSAEAREIAAQGLNLPLKSLSNHYEGIGGTFLSDKTLDMNGKGKTVRQLSRLWQYAGGAHPAGEGVVIVNTTAYSSEL